MNDRATRVRVVGPLARYADGFRAVLAQRGYAPSSAAGQLQLMAHVSRWLVQRGLAGNDLSPTVVEQFLLTRRAAGYGQWLSVRGMGPLLGYLRRVGLDPVPPPVLAQTPVETLLADYRIFLVEERGLAASTAGSYPYRAQQLAPIPGRTASSRCPVNDPLCEPATWGWACEHGVVDDADLLEREMVICHECGAEVPVVDGATHGYVPAVAGCWATFTQLQADELRRWGRALAHGVVVDSYMAQHPGDGSDPRARRSPILHLVGLCARLEHNLDDSKVGVLLQSTAETLRSGDAVALAPRTEPGHITVLDLANCDDADIYAVRARRWAAEVWRTWAHVHSRIRELYRQAWPMDR